MALLNILTFPDPRLRNVATPVEQFDEALHKLVEDMFETMYDAPGVGLAATQINVHKRVIVIDVSEDQSQPLTFINPIITKKEELHKHQEGCLSVPEYYADVERAKIVTIEALNAQGQPFEIVCENLLAVCIQHEIDHLDGKLFVDYLSKLKQEKVRKRMLQLAKANASE